MGNFNQYHLSHGLPSPSTTPNSSPRNSSSQAPSSNSSLTPREAILDALYRLVTSYDTSSLSLHDSAWSQAPHAPATFTLENTSTTYTGLSRIRAIFHDVSNLDTTHHISNPRVTIHPGGESATVTATVLAQHFRPGEGVMEGKKGLMGGSLYEAEVVRDEGDGLWRSEGLGEEVWRIRSLKMKVVWTEGDASVTSRAAEGASTL